MSVLLSACRRSRQAAITRALKRKAEKQQLKEYGKLKKEVELQELEQTDAFTKMWSFTIEGDYYLVVLYLASHKDTVDIFCNDEEITNVMTSMTPEGCTFEFVVGMSYKAIISCCGNPTTGLIHRLHINGHEVQEVE